MALFWDKKYFENNYYGFETNSDRDHALMSDNLSLIRQLKWDASSQWPFGPNCARGSLETATIGHHTPLYLVQNVSSLRQGKNGLIPKQQETSKKCRLSIHYIENECDQQVIDQNFPIIKQIMQSFFHMINSWPKIPKCVGDGHIPSNFYLWNGRCTK